MKTKYATYHLSLRELAVLLFVSGFSVAQDGLDEENLPLPETEIVCFAAKKQWVCAPADEQEKAQEKALQLVRKESPSGTNAVIDGQVEIKTMDFNNNIIESSVDEPATTKGQNQTNINEQVKDSMPQNPDTRAEKEYEKDSKKGDSGVFPATITEPTVVSSEPQLAAVNPESNFNNWQNNHAEKWSFQVVGTSSGHQLDQFVSDNGLQDLPHTIVKTQVNGADWWIVLVGLFDNREQALAQRSQLPPSLAARAWVRQIKTISGLAE